MKRIGVLTLLILATGCSTFTSTTRGTVRPDNIRGVWVDSWGQGFYTKQQCDELLEWCEDAGINTILVEVRKVGDAYYTSNLEPRGRDEETGKPIESTFDPLEYLCKAVRKQDGLRLEAWIVANRIWKGSAAPTPGWPEHPVSAHPECILIDNKGGTTLGEGEAKSVFVDPSDPAVAAHLARVAADIVRRYPVDAIHLDYIRYPGMNWGYGPRSLARFTAATGNRQVPAPDDSEFTRWRAAQVTAMLRRVKAAIRSERLGVDLTVATIAWGDPSNESYKKTALYTRTMQDWPAWCDEKLVDIAYVMHYRDESKVDQAAKYREWFRTFMSHRGRGKARIVIGQGAYKNSISDTVRQIEDALDAGFDGFCLFSYRSPNSGTAARAEAARAFREFAR